MDQNYKSKRTCSICGGPVEGMGNNPQPMLPDVEERCCDDCNDRFVVPVRLMFGGYENNQPGFMQALRKLAELGRGFVHIRETHRALASLAKETGVSESAIISALNESNKPKV